MKKRDLVEPGALRWGTLAAREGYIDEGEIQDSIAISLKRLADAVEKIAASVDRSPQGGDANAAPSRSDESAVGSEADETPKSSQSINPEPPQQ